MQGGGGVVRGVHLVDVPGHPRLRRVFERYVAGVRGVVFVVDALDFLPHTTETAEWGSPPSAPPCCLPSIFGSRRPPALPIGGS